jgi:ribosomal protein L29
MNSEKQAKRFVSVRLTEEEFKEVYRQCENSTCRSLTEYVKKVLTKKPVTVKVRNQSQDELLQTMIGLKNRLDQLAAQAEGSGVSVLLEIREIKSLTAKIAEKWLQ